MRWSPKLGLQDEIELDSAGTGAWHVGEPPDARATAAAAVRGIALDGAARQVRIADFERFDLILAMDGSNLHALRQLAPDERRAREGHAAARVRSRQCRSARSGRPDPYYDSQRGFEIVLDQVQAACEGLLGQVRPRDTVSTSLVGG